MTVFLNEEAILIASGSTLLDVLNTTGMPMQPFALALNANFVPRALLAQTPVVEGDRIELVIATQGG